MLPYGRQSITESDIEAVAEVLRGDWLTTGPAVGAFEAELARWTGGVPCVAVTSGTAALHVAYVAAGVGAGDEVVTSPLTFVATAATAALLGARVRFADVQPDTGNLDPEAAAALVTPGTKVITAVDYAGHPADYDELRQVADEAGALLVADAAHSIGSAYKGRPVGALADLTTFSFFPTKTVTTAEGGAVAAADPALLRRAALFRNHGLVREPAEQRDPGEGGWHQEVHAFGLNYRLPDVLCALGVSQLRRLERFRARRAELVARYHRLLRDVPGLTLPAQRAYVRPSWHLYPVRVGDGRRREVYERMRAAGIGVQVNYVPAYWHPAFADLGYRRGLCPRAEAYYAEELSLPLFPGLTDDQQDHVVETLTKILG
ncbi:Bacillosamine/Legionaminic acid biosynthesis aminotransferase PglE; 4-keto-6-deoxy-N-Acetyl-D-hexosaminyl-(Lipid carrier) aminotransferase [[Actinomadura] parvosata subsp. kistnae]|uniref:UDP-4-amino-4, 6-dideoxy-N-acetyl-beta-L-altrosamine transaminase n=1 Tax=[Actinomadura] parvosata subsp. kistnae TaxID=1909395 RepID=A0A1V0A9H0_9ACTN|nr:aminotransferase class V-fold PLP-dependent enzyme [Nonomuraea sp. ATCC 55076]AQZ66823.1 UDP-4-amino-4,6-dideoxy-N-acetyl-beta-L-altrosamine transaminase [Nonomuraea sp. ATCC 55076]SPL95041.1 Bacillosamine/Legionaminic acid biosynthesis aminotransferase PglE; 4-keto-6-deoxy-N-Acetyl-D-hexosaminyl-(Lipid carrier) aminotransferase [Actinomadura parvosata subsp. kistnae]